MNQQNAQHGSKQDNDQPGNSFVTIKVNGAEVNIHRGSQTGAEIKKAAGCPSTHLLKRVPGLEVVGDNDRVTIKGGEEFVCHAQIGQAS